jgi:hypothetical protein
MVKLDCGVGQRKKTEAVPLSNDVIHSRVPYVSSNILNETMEYAIFLQYATG